MKDPIARLAAVIAKRTPAKYTVGDEGDNVEFLDADGGFGYFNCDPADAPMFATLGSCAYEIHACLKAIRSALNPACGCVPICYCERLPELMRERFEDVYDALTAKLAAVLPEEAT